MEGPVLDNDVLGGSEAHGDLGSTTDLTKERLQMSEEHMCRGARAGQDLQKRMAQGVQTQQ